MTPEEDQARFYVIQDTWRTKDDEGKQTLIEELATFRSPEVMSQAAKLIEEIEDQMRLAQAHEQRIREDLEQDIGPNYL